MKKVIFKIMLMSLVFTVTSCEEPSACNNYGSDNKPNPEEIPTVALIDDYIDKIKSMTVWKDAQVLYEKTDKFIDKVDSNTLSDNEKVSKHKALNSNYCRCMENIVDNILAGPCEKQHTELKSLYKTICDMCKTIAENNDARKYWETTLKKKVDAHDMLVKWAGGLGARQNIQSCVPYDKKFEDDKKKEAEKKMMECKPTCEYITRNVKNIETSFKKRRKKYGEDITHWCVENAMTIADCNNVASYIEKYCGNEKGTVEYEGWLNAIDDKYKEIKQKTE